MSLSAIEEKYINRTLADLLEQVLYYKTKTDGDRAGARDKAIWKALYIHSIKTYNRALGTLGLVGTSNLARAQKPYTSNMLRENGIEFLTEDDIDHIVTLAYGIGKIEREQNRYEMQKKMAKAFVISHGSNNKVRAALETLVKAGAIDKLIPLDKLMEQAPTALNNLPRGNPRRGGLISAGLAKGLPLVDAHRQADLILAEEEAEAEIYDVDKETARVKATDELAMAIKQVFADEKATGNTPEQLRTKKLMEVLEIAPTEPIKPIIDDFNFGAKPIESPSTAASIELPNIPTEEELDDEWTTK